MRGGTEDDDETSRIASFLASVRSLRLPNASRKHLRFTSTHASDFSIHCSLKGKKINGPKQKELKEA